MNSAVTDSRSTRLRAFRELIGKADLDAVLVTSSANIRYLTGFSGSNALLLVTPLDTLLLTDFYIMLVASGTISDLRFIG